MTDEMEYRLEALEHPGHLGEQLRPSDFWAMFAFAFLLPVVLLVIAWGW